MEFISPSLRDLTFQARGHDTRNVLAAPIPDDYEGLRCNPFDFFRRLVRGENGKEKLRHHIVFTLGMKIGNDLPSLAFMPGLAEKIHECSLARLSRNSSERAST
ncbi:MAG: hypothetical protein R3330_14245, partial [Saprospiraceae bacterium]|nr:hypothetical protein [Saprospiraceae bacterium]